MTEANGRIKGIIFDLDGTLYRMKRYMKALITLRLFPRSLLLPRYMLVRSTFAGKDMQSGERLMAVMSEALARRTPGSSPEKMRAWISECFYRQFVAVMPMMRGAREDLNNWLQWLRDKGLRLAVLSDYARVPERLAALEIDIGLFHTVASSEQMGALKPCTRPLLHIASGWSMKPADILVVGDRQDTDGDAARKAAMRFIRITDRRKPSEGARHWRSIKNYINELV